MMYIEKRWILPALLTLLSAVGLFVVLTLANRPVQARTVERVVDVTPATGVCPVTAAAAPATPTAPPVSNAGIQTNDGGFGDIGMQFQNVNVNAPITNVHISQNGLGDTANVNVGQGNTITQSAPAVASTSTPSSTSSSTSGSTTPSGSQTSSSTSTGHTGTSSSSSTPPAP